MSYRAAIPSSPVVDLGGMTVGDVVRRAWKLPDETRVPILRKVLTAGGTYRDIARVCKTSPSTVFQAIGSRDDKVDVMSLPASEVFSDET